MILFLFVFYIIYETDCAEKALKSKNPLPYFRRQVEEVIEDTIIRTTVAEDSPSNLVSLLIKNAKEIYSELDVGDVTKFYLSNTLPLLIGTTTSKMTFGNLSFEPPMQLFAKKNEVVRESNMKRAFSDLRQVHYPMPSTTAHYTEKKDILKWYKNVTFVPFSDKEIIDMNLTIHKAQGRTFKPKEDVKGQNEFVKNLILFEKDNKQKTSMKPIDVYSMNVSVGDSRLVRSCIYCNNVALENCNDPKHRLIPSTMCDHEDDLCYTLHTPFGVVDRGCFSLNHNLTTYVCNCNLCNHISITEMPIMFSKKQEWTDNIVELSRTKKLRKTIMKDMACLRCEANSSNKAGNMIDAVNCLEGNIASLPSVECQYNEVCAIKSIKKEGYVWRGCVKYPLFNYWWSLCDNDLCNYDPLVSIFDTE